jgi:hypothetical protein
MKIPASILALIAFVAIFMNVLAEARLRNFGWDVDGGNEVGEPLLCHSRRGRNCGYLEYYKPNGRIDFNSPSYSSWRADHPRGSRGGNRYDVGRLWDEDDDESVGMPGFIGSSFRHSVNNLRPEVQRANRNGVIRGIRSTFRHAGDIPRSKSDFAVKGLELGSNMRKHGYGSKGMGNWRRDEMAFDEEESVGWDDQPSHTRPHMPDRQSISNYYNNWRL